MKPFSYLHYKHEEVRQLIKIGRVLEGQVRTALKLFKNRHGLSVDWWDTTNPNFSTTDFTVRIGHHKIHIEAKRKKNRFNLFDWKWVGRPRFKKKGTKALIHAGISKPLSDRLHQLKVIDLEIPYQEEATNDNSTAVLAWLEEMYNQYWEEICYVSRHKKALIQTPESLIPETPPLGG